ncbi:MAG: RpiB/LacA/LacB family sugar-phosphate isomerase [Candidatus Dojkabacteria bacterium]
MKIFIASDHGGFDLKRDILHNEDLKRMDLEFEDLGAPELVDGDDYTDYAFTLVEEMKKHPSSLGILICRSGIGMSIAANKAKGIYAALCFTPKHAIMAREHNNANVLCLDSDYEDKEIHFKIIENFVKTEFAGFESRHGRRVKEIMKFEETK